VVNCIVIRHIVDDIERVDVVAHVMVRHFGFFVVLKIVEDGFLSNFVRQSGLMEFLRGEGKRG